MREADFQPFTELLDAVCSLLSRGAYQPNATNAALFFRALNAHSLPEVRAAFDAHVRDPQRGKFVPTPADIIAQIQGLAADDGRPGAEEAWAMALRSRDEADTVVWTEEIAAAIGIAKPVLDEGDEVGARMAFREAYNRLVDIARPQHMPAAWTVSIGFDPARRDAAIREAVAFGRLPQSELPQLAAPSQPLLALARNAAIPAAARDALMALSERLRNRQDEPSADAVGRQQTDEAKARMAESVREYTERQRQEAALDAELKLAEEGEQAGECDGL